jgi:hypothetical protein
MFSIFTKEKIIFRPLKRPEALTDGIRSVWQFFVLFIIHVFIITWDGMNKGMVNYFSESILNKVALKIMTMDHHC